MFPATPADLEILRGTSEWPIILQVLAGSRVVWDLSGAEPVRGYDDLSVLNRFGWTPETLAAEIAAAGIAIPDPVAPVILQPDPVIYTVDDYAAAVEARINAVAAEKSYSSGVSCASYTISTIAAWKAEADAFIAWRDATWTAAYAALAAWQAGGDAPTSPEAFVATLPALMWPA